VRARFLGFARSVFEFTHPSLTRFVQPAALDKLDDAAEFIAVKPCAVVLSHIDHQA
jgi:hypothetical protein